MGPHRVSPGGRTAPRGRPPPALVAHHSGAVFAAEARGLDTHLAAYPREVSTLADALTYADQTTDPAGQPVGFDQRLTEAPRRHGAGSAQAAAHTHREPYLRGVAQRIEQRFTAKAAPAATRRSKGSPVSR
jgi:hypothetical protein